MDRKQLIRALLIAIATAVVAACGGGGGGDGGSGAVDDRPQVITDRPDPVQVEPDPPVSITGAGVKGPLAFADVSVFRLDATKPDLHDASAAVAQGDSDAYATIRDVIIPDPEQAPFVMVVDGTRSVDLNTGYAPILGRLLTVITAETVAAGDPVYATPITTLMVYMAQLHMTRHPDHDVVIAFQVASDRIKNALGIEFNQDTDFLTDPPLIDERTTSVASQRRVLEHRTAVETLAALVYAASAEDTTESRDDVLRTLARDLYDDRQLDGRDRNGPIADINSAAFTLDPSALTVPNSQVALTDVIALLAMDQDYLPQTSGLFTDSIQVNFTNQLTRTAVTDPDGGGVQVTLTLSWEPSLGFVEGYRVYHGTTAAGTDILSRDLVLANGDANPDTPAASFDATADLSLALDDQVCFRVTAYNQAGESEPSEAVCTII